MVRFKFKRAEQEEPAPDVGRLSSASKTGLKPTSEREEEVLRVLRRTGTKRIRVAQVAEAIGVSPARVSQVMSKLESENRIIRRDRKISEGYRYSVAKAEKPSPDEFKAETKPHRPDIKARVLTYIESHQEQLISYDDIARVLDCSGTYVGRTLRQLFKEGKIDRSGATPDGTRYRVIRAEVQTQAAEGTPSVPETTEPVSKNNQQFIGLLEPLMWEFIKSTRSTDILVFLTWLEEKK